MRIDPYIIFNGQCEEAFRHYQQVLGGELVAMIPHSQIPDEAKMGPEMDNMIMHARLVIGNAVLMGSDSPPAWYERPQGHSVSLQFDTIEEAEHAYNELSPGGNIKMALQETFWAHRFAMFTDKYGTQWMVNCEKPMG